MKNTTTLKKVLSTAIASAFAMGISTGAMASDIVTKPSHPVKSLEYGEVLFEYYQDNYFPALSQYFYAKDIKVLKDQGTEATLVSGAINVGLTMPQHAIAIFEGLLKHAKDDLTRDQAWFHLANLYYVLGDIDNASTAIDNVGNSIPNNLKQRFNALYINIKVRFQKAGELDEYVSALTNKPGAKAFVHYNLGVARNRDEEELDTIVDEFLRTISYAPNTEAGKNLIDKVYLTLGKVHFDHRKYETALEFYKKVRMDAAYGNNALLGYGWTLIKMEQYEQALTPWFVLSEKNIEDPRVLETQLAIPYALEKLEAEAQALQYYQSADDNYTSATVKLEQLMFDLGGKVEVKTKKSKKKLSRKQRRYAQKLAKKEAKKREKQRLRRMEKKNFLDVLLANQPEDAIGWQKDINFSLKQGEVDVFLTDLLASKPFQEAFTNYRDLHYLKRNLKLWQTKLTIYQKKEKELSVLSEHEQKAFALANSKNRLKSFRKSLKIHQGLITQQIKRLDKQIKLQRGDLLVLTRNYLESQQARVSYYQSQGRLAIARILDLAEQEARAKELEAQSKAVVKSKSAKKEKAGK